MKQLITVLLITLGFTASAQEVYTSSGRPVGAKQKQQKKQEPQGFDWNRIVVGGTLGFGIGDTTIALLTNLLQVSASVINITSKRTFLKLLTTTPIMFTTAIIKLV